MHLSNRIKMQISESRHEPQITVDSHHTRGNNNWKSPQRHYNQPCIFYLQGRCKNGSKCKYWHNEDIIENEESRNTYGEHNKISLEYPTRYSDETVNQPTQRYSDLLSIRIDTSPEEALNERCSKFDRGYCPQGKYCTRKHMRNRVAPYTSQPQPPNPRK